MSKTAIILPIYNQAERGYQKVCHIQQYVRQPYKMFVIDNGSKKLVEYATHRINPNHGTGAGMWYGIDQAGKDYDYYWLLSTSLQFVERIDVLEALIDLQKRTGAAGVATGWIGEMKAWTHKKIAYTGEDHIVDLLGLSALWDARWWHEVGGFDRALTTGWGSDYELTHKAHESGRELWVSGKVSQVITEGATYNGNLDAMMDYQRRATDEMNTVLESKYGLDWREKLLRNVVIPV